MGGLQSGVRPIPVLLRPARGSPDPHSRLPRPRLPLRRGGRGGPQHHPAARAAPRARPPRPSHRRLCPHLFRTHRRPGVRRVDRGREKIRNDLLALNIRILFKHFFFFLEFKFLVFF